MSNVNFKLLRRGIADAGAQTFEAVKSAHPSESLYAFALYIHDDATAIIPSINSEEAYGRAAAQWSADESFTSRVRSRGKSLEKALLHNLRWSPFDWAYDCAAPEAFIALSDLTSNGGSIKRDPLGYERFKARVMASMVLGLQDMAAAGSLGKATVTLFCSVTDSEDATWFEEDSARRLNSPRLFETFLEERIKYIRGGAQAEKIDPRSVHGLYLAQIQAADSEPWWKFW